MLRTLHKLPGLIAALLIVVMTLGGAVLSVLPAIEVARTPDQAEPGLSVATLAARVVAAYPGVEQIRRAPSGRITAFYFDNGRPGSVVIDPATGAGVADYEPSGFERWMTNLHRSLFLGDADGGYPHPFQRRCRAGGCVEGEAHFVQIPGQFQRRCLVKIVNCDQDAAFLR